MSSNLKLKDCVTSETLANADTEITEKEAKGKNSLFMRFQKQKKQ